MLENVLNRQDRHDKRYSLAFKGLVVTVLLAWGVLMGWAMLEALGWWRIPALAVGLSACVVTAYWLFKTKNLQARNAVTDIAFFVMLALTWGPGFWRRLLPIGPEHGLAMAALGLVLWLVLWGRFRDWAAVNVLPLAFLVAITGYICVGFLSGHTIFAELMHPVLAAVLFLAGLVFYGFLAFRIWFAKNRTTDKLQES